MWGGGRNGPLEERDPPGDQSVGVGVVSVKQLLLEQPGKFECALAAMEDAAAFEDHDVGRDVAGDVLVETGARRPAAGDRRRPPPDCGPAGCRSSFVLGHGGAVIRAARWDRRTRSHGDHRLVAIHGGCGVRTAVPQVADHPTVGRPGRVRPRGSWWSSQRPTSWCTGSSGPSCWCCGFFPAPSLATSVSHADAAHRCGG
jgi:hypothetical protein